MIPLLAGLALLLVPLALGAVVYSRKSTGPARARQVLAAALLYAALGPPLGGLLVAIPGLLTVEEREPVVMLAFIVGMAWMFGGLPALVAGACMALLRPNLGSGWRLLAAAACGGIASALFAVLVDLHLQGVALLVGLGALCALLVEATTLAWQKRRARTAAPHAP